MVGCKKKAEKGVAAESKRCTARKKCCGSVPGAKQAGMIGLTALATIGPKKLRPHVQNILAVIAIASLIRQIIRRGKGQEA